MADSIDFRNLDLFSSGRTDAIFAKLRKEAPVYWNPTENGTGFWALSKYEDIVSTWKNTSVFSSEYGNMLRLLGGHDPSAGKMMVVTDPPRHHLLRKMHNEAVNPKKVSQMEPKVHSFVCELLDSIAEGESFDFTVDIAAKLPVSVTCDLLGVPREDWKLVADLCKASITAEDPENWHGQDAEETLAMANVEILAYLLELIHQRRRNPGHDMISMLIESRVDGSGLGDQEIALNGFSILLGGIETTKYAAAGGLLALLEHPEEAERLHKQPSLMPKAVEEILRWTTPNAHVLRVAKQDVQIRDVLIRAGQTVTLWVASANRDEDVFEDPYRFRIDRAPNPHLTFGSGGHYCLGGGLARMELNLLFSEIVARGYEIRTAGPAVRLRSNFLSGYTHVPVRFTR